MNKEELMNTLKVGDEVVIREYGGTYGERVRTFAKVAKVTATQITLDNGARYKKVDGREWGMGDSRYGTMIETDWNGGYNGHSLTTRSEAEKRNQEIIAKRELSSLVQKIRTQISSNNVTLEQAREIIEMMGVEA